MACVKYAEDDGIQFDTQLMSEFWSLDSTTFETNTQIKQQSKILNVVITLNSLFGILTGLILIPTGKEQEFHFYLYFSREYLFCHYFFDIIYFLGFPIVSYTIVSVANILAYYTCHTIFQINLALDVIKYMSEEYKDIKDDILLQNVEYQEIIKKRLIFIIVRHCVLSR